MTVKQTSYRHIMKATSIFGGVQVFNIIIAIIRTKFIAVLLGPAGMGIAGLLTSTIGLIGSLTNFGLGTSAVRNISVAVATEDNDGLRITVSTVRRLVWYTGLLGTLVTFFLSPFLSEMTFGNKDYSFAFMCLSIILLLSQLSTGQVIILQGMRKLKYLAKAELAGTIVGLLISVPIYYVLGIRGIVPAIIVSSMLALFFSWFFASKLNIPAISVDKVTFKTESTTMLRMGFMLSLSGIITVGASYLLRIFIGRTGGIEQVGLYNAGFAIINTYVGMIFTAMTTDYYPRLAEASSDHNEIRKVINEQAEIAILLIAPILVGFITFIKWGLVLLYSYEFIAVKGMLHWAALGMFFKTISWAIGFVFLAKGSPRMFFWNELIANIYLLLLNVLGYHFLGLNGLGVSFLVGYILFFAQVFIVARIYYTFNIEKSFLIIFTNQLLIGLACFIVMIKVPSAYSYMLNILLLAISLGYSYNELDKRIGIKQILQNFTKRQKDKS
ncbi:O-antigen translocase [Pontibacter pamirensis]|uniref:O-antigen translocase n=1 Tax=Pontibacter pamirensis TaxID=2562824 RepID=UPI00138A23A6|nr:O-antigen translocase [Pontibacter pamirensis]